MRLHHAFGLVTMLLLIGELSIASSDRVQASHQMTFKLSVDNSYSYQPPSAGTPGGREGGGTR